MYKMFQKKNLNSKQHCLSPPVSANKREANDIQRTIVVTNYYVGYII